MNLQWPVEFIADAKTKGANKVFGLEYGTGAGSCANCSGLGAMYAFYVESGPLAHAPGQGKIGKYLPDFGGWYVGETKSAPCPVCQGDSRALWLRKVCGLEGEALNKRLGDFSLALGKERAHQVAVRLLSQTPNPIGFVTFWGGYGVGKSLLLSILVNSFRVAGILSVYTTTADMLGSVRETFGNDSVDAAETLIREHRNVRVLAIDEYDRVNLTPWAQETLFRVLDYRYRNMSSSLTILAANVNPEMVDGPLAYLTSRMTEGEIVHVGGTDMRPATH